MSMKNVRKAITLNNLVSSDTVNGRRPDNYDLEALRPAIEMKGKIVNPPVVEPIRNTDGTETGKYSILQGNRRVRCAAVIVADKNSTPELVKALEKVDCLVYAELTDLERETLIFDHGETKPLNREETVHAVWRLFKQFRTEKEIGQLLYHQLARYTGNEKKLNNLSSEPAAREKELNAWFRGTLGGYMLAAAQMGEYVRSQFILTARGEDGKLAEGEKVEMKCSRTRISALSQAKTADTKAGGWKQEEGGESFNALIQKFKDEDAGIAESGPKDKRPTVKELNERIALFKSAPIRAAFSVAAGDKTAGNNLLTLDDMIHRQTLVGEVIVKALPSVKDEFVKAFLSALISDGPAADVEMALAPFVS